MILDVTKLRSTRFVTKIGTDWVRSASGIKLNDLQNLLRKRGTRLPIYTSALEATLGGTLAAGGISGRSFRKGFLASQVIELHLMGTDGKIWKCSMEENKDIFSCSLATMGMNGVLLSAKLNTESLLPFRVQLLIKDMPFIEITSLCNKFKKIPEIISMEGYINANIQNTISDVYCAIEAKDKDEVIKKINIWKKIINEFELSSYNHTIKVVHIDNPLGFSASISGWSITGSEIIAQSLKINKPSIGYSSPVSAFFEQKEAIKFINAYSAFINENKYFGGENRKPPYFCVIDSMHKSNQWMRLSNECSHIIAFDLFAIFPYSDMDRGIKELNDLTKLVAKFKGRLYPYGFIPEKEILLDILPTKTKEMQEALIKTDPEKLIKSILVR
jgi:hypothetical protein